MENLLSWTFLYGGRHHPFRTLGFLNFMNEKWGASNFISVTDKKLWENVCGSRLSVIQTDLSNKITGESNELVVVLIHIYISGQGKRKRLIIETGGKSLDHSFGHEIDHETG